MWSGQYAPMLPGNITPPPPPFPQTHPFPPSADLDWAEWSKQHLCAPLCPDAFPNFGDTNVLLEIIQPACGALQKEPLDFLSSTALRAISRQVWTCDDGGSSAVMLSGTIALNCLSTAGPSALQAWLDPVELPKDDELTSKSSGQPLDFLLQVIQ